MNKLTEEVEFLVNENSKIVDIPLKDLSIKRNILIAAIVREGQVMIPGGNSVIKANDSVIVISHNHILDDLKDILV